jgi:excisionase family DNA binding protein
MTGEQLMTASQLAQRWQVAEQHVYRLTRQGAVPAVKLGRYYRYRLDAIEAFERGEMDDNGEAAT